MTRKLILAFVFLGNTLLFAQTGTINVKLVDKETKAGIPFANVTAFSNGKQTGGATTNIDGKALIKSLSPRKYTLKVTYVGYQPVEMTNVVVSANKVSYVSIEFTKGVELKPCVISYNKPLIRPDNVQGHSITREEISNLSYQPKPMEKEIRRESEKKACFYPQYNDATRVVLNEYNTEEYKGISENGFNAVRKKPLSTFSIDVDKASYSNVRRYINAGQLPPKDAVRIEELINYFSYDYPQPKGENPFSINMEMAECPWNKKHQLIHVGLQGKKIETTNLPPSNLVFLIDVSGSMNQPNKLPLVKSSLNMLVEQLREEDKISIVVYAGAAGLILPSTHGDNKKDILAAIENLQAGGSTAGGAGILLAYKMAKENFMKSGNNRVILATDGDFNVGVSSEGDLTNLIEEKRKENIFLTVLGFGTGNYKDAKMELLADKGNGNYAYIDNILEAKKVLVKEMGGTLYTIAKDVKIQVEFNPVKVKEYRLIGYENRLLADEDFNDDRKDAGEIGSGHTVTALYEIIPGKSEETMDKIDPLKYQRATNIADSESNELLTIKFRYKDPKDTTSKLIVKTLIDKPILLENTSDNFRFSAAVSEFGFLLRDSEFKGDTSYKELITLAKNSKGKDEEGYRAEFIRLAETTELMDKSSKKEITNR